ncbi:MAG: hypothetical protein ACFB4I_04595 [Cyanophyceae cyanobacterium]
MLLSLTVVGNIVGGKLNKAKQLNGQAFEKEAQAAALVADNLTAEPTRSVLHRSAAALAIDCGDFSQAQRLIQTGLAGTAPQEIAGELTNLLEEAIALAKNRQGIYLSA